MKFTKYVRPVFHDR